MSRLPDSAASGRALEYCERVLLPTGRALDAMEQAQRALSLLSKQPGTPQALRARAHTLHARALAAAGFPEEAEEEARRAD